MTPKPNPELTPRRKRDSYSDEEITAFEISEDRRLRELGINPDDHPISIYRQLLTLIEQHEIQDEAAPLRETTE